ncbi:stress transcription factor A [Seminavis robusta]|uniref:Stress transcription factor A n=1 Tax=Seminavis robusta TaxID=568900 RepID=A0A9N8EUB0_9STRA|nr:stress transcription factor A [Seminavis robusta]|eukprot:Sro1900_g304240.1 stress transcription factor A (487) ;mRNA; f:5170-6824
MAMETVDGLNHPAAHNAKDLQGSTQHTSTTMLESRLSRLRDNCRKSSRRKSKRTYVKHNYDDHYFDPIIDPIEEETERDESSRRGPRGGVVEPFPERLYKMLRDAEPDKFENVVSWQPHGRCFIVHDPKAFVEEIMPKYFRQSKLTSFQRQVNLYGFRRLTAGTDRGGYYHQLFLRGRPDLHRRMVRMRVKGTGCKSAASPATEPNFYGYETCKENDPRIDALKVAIPAIPSSVHGEEPSPNQSTEEVQSPETVSMMPTTEISAANCQPRFSNHVAEYNPSHEVASIDHHMHGSMTMRLLPVTSTDKLHPKTLMPDEQVSSLIQNELAPCQSQCSSRVPPGSNDGILRPLAAPRMLPRFPGLGFGSMLQGQKEVDETPGSGQNAGFLCHFGLPSEEHCRNEKQSLAVPVLDSMLLDAPASMEEVPQDDSFQDQIRRLLQDPYQHFESVDGNVHTSEHMDGFEEWQLDPLFIQGELVEVGCAGPRFT